MSFQVLCPNCGQTVSVDVPHVANAKGMGKKTGRLQTKLSAKQVWVLESLKAMKAIDEDTAVTRQSLYQHIRNQAMREEKRIPSSHIVGFWLSALLGAGFVSMTRGKCKTIDTATQTIRFVHKPCWFLSGAYLAGNLSLEKDRTIIRGDQHAS